MATIQLKGDGILEIHLPGLTAICIDPVARVIAVDGISGSASHVALSPEWTVLDLRHGTYGDFHRLGPADECPDRDCIGAGEHVRLSPGHPSESE
jgi:hypothetical protein